MPSDIFFLTAGPILLCIFIKDHISCNCDLLGDWIISFVGFCSSLIPNKDHLSPLVIQLQVRLGVAHIDNAAEGFQVKHRRPLGMPDLKWCLAIHCFARHHVQEVNNGDHCPPPQTSRVAPSASTCSSLLPPP
jgi:hypothetical protein